MIHADYITHIKNAEDVDYLTRPLHNVNIRLFKTSPKYREIVMFCCNYIELLAATEKDGYKKPHGMSGANAAIPFNIIGIVRNRNTKDEWIDIMINPRIVEKSNEALSNCGSLTLDRPIKVRRHKWVKVGHYNRGCEGEYFTVFMHELSPTLTVQHEIDHNQGVLITDREIK